MKLGRALAVAVMLLLFAGVALADSIPLDPRIGIDGGTGTIAYNGFQSLTLAPNIGATDANPVHCGWQHDDGTINCSTEVFGNITGAPITAFDFSFFTSGGFAFAEAPFSPTEGSIFQWQQTVSDSEVIFSAAEGQFIDNCHVADSESFGCTNGIAEFSVSLVGVKLDSNGQVVMTFSAVPEPATLFLLCSSGSLLYWRRRRIRI